MKQTETIPADRLGEYITINGRKEYLYHVPGKKASLPVIIYLHAGPGLPGSLLEHVFPEELREYYHTVYWDQPGTGKTLQKNGGYYPDFEELLADLNRVVAYVKQVYRKEKVILFGHSLGSLVGSLYALSYPEDLLCYITAAPMVSFRQNEITGLLVLKNKAINAGRKKDFNRLEELSPYPDEAYSRAFFKKFKTVRSIQREYDGGTDLKDLLSVIRKSPIYRPADLLSLYKGIERNDRLWADLLECNLMERDATYRMPVFFLWGEAENIQSEHLARMYFNHLSAPEKEFFELPGAGHFMMLEQPEEYLKVLKVIRGMMMMFSM